MISARWGGALLPALAACAAPLPSGGGASALLPSPAQPGDAALARPPAVSPDLLGAGVLFLPREEGTISWSAQIEIAVDGLPGDVSCQASFEEVGAPVTSPTCDGCDAQLTLSRRLIRSEGTCSWEASLVQSVGVWIDEEQILKLDADRWEARYVIVGVFSTLSDQGETLELDYVGDPVVGFEG